MLYDYDYYYHYYDNYDDYDYYDQSDENVIDPYYPCIKYKKLADQKYDGTDYFIVAESMNLNGMDSAYERFSCFLSFNCENDEKAFYKLIKGCLQIRIHEESFCDFCKQYRYSLILLQTNRDHYK